MFVQFHILSSPSLSASSKHLISFNNSTVTLAAPLSQKVETRTSVMPRKSLSSTRLTRTRGSSLLSRSALRNFSRFCLPRFSRQSFIALLIVFAGIFNHFHQASCIKKISLLFSRRFFPGNHAPLFLLAEPKMTPNDFLSNKTYCFHTANVVS